MAYYGDYHLVYNDPLLIFMMWLVGLGVVVSFYGVVISIRNLIRLQDERTATMTTHERKHRLLGVKACPWCTKP